jgi:hypothetical protein
VAGNCECGNKPSGFIKWGNVLTSCKLVSFSSKTLLHRVSKLSLLAWFRYMEEQTDGNYDFSARFKGAHRHLNINNY